MPTYACLSGEMLDYPTSPPVVVAFLERAIVAARDPSVGMQQMVELVYGNENPILDYTRIPGRGLVTRDVFESPTYRILSDLIGVKRIQLGLLDMSKVEAAHNVSVKEAAEQLGITPASVRAAIVARKLAGHMRNGQWYTRPESVAAYMVSNRGRKKKPNTADPKTKPVRVKGRK